MRLAALLLIGFRLAAQQSNVARCHVYLVDPGLGLEALKALPPAQDFHEALVAVAEARQKGAPVPKPLQRFYALIQKAEQILGRFSAEIQEEKMTEHTYPIPGSKWLVKASVYYTDELMASPHGHRDSIHYGWALVQDASVAVATAKENAIAEIHLSDNMGLVRVKRNVVIDGRTYLLGLECDCSRPPELSGEWKLNLRESRFDFQPPPKYKTLRITHKEPKIEIAIEEEDQRGKVSGSTRHTTDGKEQVNDVAGNPMKSVAVWEGSGLVVRTWASFGGNEIQLIDRYFLSKDRLRLQLYRRSEGQRGGVQNGVLAFDRVR